MSNQENKAISSLVLLTAVSVTAAVTYTLTKRREENKQKAIALRQYERNKIIKEKTAKARMEAHEPPSGKLMNDVRIDKIFLWECEDLRKRFPSAMIENIMKFKVNGPANIRAPALRGRSAAENEPQFVEQGEGSPYNKLITDHECILGTIVRKPNMHTHTVSYMRAGPRKLLHFDPKIVNAAIVTCGGLCPGLNNVIREITKTLHQIYGIGGKVYGIQGGFCGFHDPAYSPVILTPAMVESIHHSGGTVLGSSRGGFDLDKILAFLKDKKINNLYVIGGDGTHRGAFRIHEGCMEHGMNVSVAGIPKTIDNDVDYIDHSFGFSSAVEAAQIAIRSAKTEAMCNLPNGSKFFAIVVADFILMNFFLTYITFQTVGIVKLMGRSAGFIAAHATMSSADVDLCLVPEVPIVLEGPTGCLPHLMRRVKQQGYAVVVVAEGAGEDLLGTCAETDASGNKKLPAIGEFMKSSIVDYFAKEGETATVKYIDPSYTVRSVPANAADSLYCMQLAQNAVHGKSSTLRKGSLASYTFLRRDDKMLANLLFYRRHGWLHWLFHWPL